MSAGNDTASGRVGWPQIPDHELLRQIGGGSYGDVWLARSATGVFRAVKVLQRSRFGDDQHPFEREFQGLQRFEPVSREHEHLVDVLHIGRHDDVLYYVMELADDANEREGGAGIEPDAYDQDTLSGRLRQVGRFKITECIEFARSLSQALAHLHASGLIHRDIKPSNVLFVDGVLKLADVGLVSAPDATVSLVGTEGFIPPEGPGTVQADLYAMGKILYEISSGMDRMDFPAVPDWVCDEPGDGEWSEFNEVVLKCCEKDPDRRYATAEEVLADLDLLDTGRSLVRRRRGRRLLQVSTVASLVLLAAGLLVSLGAFVAWKKGEADAVVKATTYLERPLRLHSIELSVSRFGNRTWDCSPDGRLLAVATGGEIMIVTESRAPYPAVTEIPDGWRFHIPRWIDDGRRLVCPASRGLPSEETPQENALILINCDERCVEDIPFRTTDRVQSLAVTPATGTAAVAAGGFGDGERRMLGINLEDGSEEVWLQGDAYWLGDFSPDGRWLAFRRLGTSEGDESFHGVSLFSVADRTEQDLFDLGAFARHPAWGAEGDYLFFIAGASHQDDETLNLWRLPIDLATGQPRGEVEQLTRFRDAQALFPQVIRDTQNVLVARTNTGTTLWSAPGNSPEEAVRVIDGTVPRLSSNGEWLFFLDRRQDRQGLYRIPTDSSGHAQKIIGGLPIAYDIAPNGQEVVVAQRVDGSVRLFTRSVEDGTERDLVTAPGARGVGVAWAPNSALIAYTDGPDLNLIAPDGTGLRTLGTLEDWDENVWEGHLQWSPDSSMIAGFGYPDAASMKQMPENNHVVVGNVGEGTVRSVTSFEADSTLKECLCWHPDGEFLTYQVYDRGEVPAQIRMAFPDGRPTKRFIELADHWDWGGTWHPDGERFYFLSYADEESDKNFLHIWSSGEVEHATPPLALASFPPRWSADGSRMVWGTTAGHDKTALILLEPVSEP